MDKERVMKIINQFKESLKKHGINVSKIILFGSYAKDTWHEGSDIDLVVISDDFRGKDLYERIKMLVKPIAELFEPIEARAFTEEEWEHGDSLFIDCVKSDKYIEIK